MNTLASSFLIRSTSFLQVTRTYIKAWMSSNFGYHHQLQSYLPLHDLKIDVLSCEHSSAYIYDRIFFIFAGNEDNNKVSDKFEIPPDPTTDCKVSCLERLEKSWEIFNWIVCIHAGFNWIFCIHAGNKGIHESLDEFGFRQICNTVTALDWRQNSVFAQYLGNESIDWD